MASPGDQELLRFLRETKKLSLQNIHLLESHCKLGQMREAGLPGQANQTISLSIQIESVNKVAVVVAAFKLVFTYDGSNEGEPPLMLSGNFGLRYVFTTPFAKKRLQPAVERTAILNAWPYWRELVHSLTTRMGLPVFPVPLLNVANLQKAPVSGPGESHAAPPSAP